MELSERSSTNISTKKEENATPWYKRRNNLIIMVCAALALICIFGGVFGSMSNKKQPVENEENNKGTSLIYEQNDESQKQNTVTDEQINTTEPQAAETVFPIEWDGMCPKSAGKCPPSFQDDPPLIVLSLDGYYPSIMDRGLTPVIEKLAKCGSHAPYIFSAFPTKSFPNHLSQVTGRYPAYHGITDNHMYDPFIKKNFHVVSPESFNPAWWTADPIWVTAEKQNLTTASYFWPGSYVKINGTWPTYYKATYDLYDPLVNRANQALKWLDLPATSRPKFIALYSHQPDHDIHEYGMGAEEIDDPLIKVNNMIERLFSGLQKRNLINCVDVIIMSDHGMAQANCSRAIDLRNYVNVNDTSYMNLGAVGIIRPKDGGNATDVKELVSQLRCQNPHLRIYPKQQLPVRVHYADNPRIEPIFLHLDPGWTVVNSDVEPGEFVCSGGKHGYDNLFPEMKAFFLAYGPSFKKNFTTQPFMSIELYEMFAELIGVTPNPNNGTRGSLHHMMTSPNMLPPQAEQIPPATGYIPSDENVYNERLGESTCYCNESWKQKEIFDIDSIRDVHLPFGIPYSAADNSSLLLLYNHDYVTAFNTKYRMPLWTSFTLQKKKISGTENSFCWNGDVRVPSNDSAKCDDYLSAIEKDENIFLRPLYPPDFSDVSVYGEANLITNAVMKSANHSNIIEKPFYDMLKRWFVQTGQLNVIIGPGFDIFASGIRPEDEEFNEYYERYGPALVPTHIYAVTTWCAEKVSSLNDCDPSKLQAQGFILPNQPYPINCETPGDFIRLNVARVVDVEILTGLSLFKKLPVYDAIRLRTVFPERHF